MNSRCPHHRNSAESCVYDLDPGFLGFSTGTDFRLPGTWRTMKGRFKWLLSFKSYCPVAWERQISNKVACFFVRWEDGSRLRCSGRKDPWTCCAPLPGLRAPCALWLVPEHMALCTFLHFWESPALQVPEKHILQRGRAGQTSVLITEEREEPSGRIPACKGSFKTRWAQVSPRFYHHPLSRPALVPP